MPRLSSSTQRKARLVSPLRLPVVALDRLQTELTQTAYFIGFGKTVVVLVLPQPQVAEDRVSVGNQAIVIATFGRLIVFDQSVEAVSTVSKRWVGLRREVAEQLRSIGYRSVAVTI
jgi:hypothetical protein